VQFDSHGRRYSTDPHPSQDCISTSQHRVHIISRQPQQPRVPDRVPSKRSHGCSCHLRLWGCNHTVRPPVTTEEVLDCTMRHQIRVPDAMPCCGEAYSSSPNKLTPSSHCTMRSSRVSEPHGTCLYRRNCSEGSPSSLCNCHIPTPQRAYPAVSWVSWNRLSDASLLLFRCRALK
jgi:hypothetical protein